jgi:predicted hydrocarbon binding protein
MNAREDAVIINSLVRQALTSPNNLEPSIQTSQYARLNQAIEDFYGRAGKGMLRRIGKASFQYGVREQAALLGIAGVAIKLLPEKQRIKFILNGMANALKKSNPAIEAWVDEQDDVIAYIEKTCSVCWGRQSDQPLCHLYAGSVGEAVLWATGVERDITETHCLAKGDEYCRFEVGEIKT